jgi:hypothetical protein
MDGTAPQETGHKVSYTEHWASYTSIRSRGEGDRKREQASEGGRKASKAEGGVSKDEAGHKDKVSGRQRCQLTFNRVAIVAPAEYTEVDELVHAQTQLLQNLAHQIFDSEPIEPAFY